MCDEEIRVEAADAGELEDEEKSKRLLELSTPMARALLIRCLTIWLCLTMTCWKNSDWPLKLVRQNLHLSDMFSEVLPPWLDEFEATLDVLVALSELPFELELTDLRDVINKLKLLIFE